jgi:hypothetical protein
MKSRYLGLTKKFREVYFIKIYKRWRSSLTKNIKKFKQKTVKTTNQIKAKNPYSSIQYPVSYPVSS